MPEIARIVYGQTQDSIRLDPMGMRQMQQKVYACRDSQFILLKAPPASGKSRAFMFIALDKMIHQGLKKTIIAVPEKDIGASFKKTDLRTHGFFADWEPTQEYDLCGYGGADNSAGKIKTFKKFLEQDEAKILICTHATLRFAFDTLHDSDFNGIFLGIDEFHHASADTDNSRLGELIKGIVTNSTAHLMAMTGSYFRGDGIAVIPPDIERKFTTVTYSYYDQLSGCKWLRGITLRYEFYQGVYLDAVRKVLDTTQKTIIHIPNVNSLESTKQKYEEAEHIIDIIGDAGHEDPLTGVIPVTTEDGRTLKIIDLVEDDPDIRQKRQAYIREHAQEKDAIDIIIALNLAKEGFDWPPCEHMLTIGYRGSLTEIVQIIGRCTRDYEGKTEAYFTNLIAEPDAGQKDVVASVNDLLKAITASLLMEQVLLPKWNFMTKIKPPKLAILQPETQKAKDILENDYEDLLSYISTNQEVIEAIPKKDAAKVINKLLIPKIILEKYPDLPVNDVEAIRQNVVAGLVLDSTKEAKGDNQTDVRLLHFPNTLCVDIRDLDINLIDTINPFEQAYQILSKDIDANTLASVRDVISSQRNGQRSYTQEELTIYWPQIESFYQAHQHIPEPSSEDAYEAKLGSVLYWVRKQKENLHGNESN
jgi:superfamily II DNA or RNA helicase